jgi:hypothetical protein
MGKSFPWNVALAEAAPYHLAKLASWKNVIVIGLVPMETMS